MSAAGPTTEPPAAVPSLREPAARAAAPGIGGVWGRHAAVLAHGWWTPVRVLLALTTLTLILGYVQKSPCATGNWVGNKQYTHFCYSDVVPLWSAERLDVGGVPYRDTAVEYPVLTGGFMWGTALLTRALTSLGGDWSHVVVFGALTALLLAACALVITAATAHTARRRPYDAAIFALSPLLVFHAFSNWDLLAMALASGALWAWARGRPVLAGVLIGLGTAAKLYPVLLLVPLVILAVRTRLFRDVGWTVVAALVTWATVNLPVAAAYTSGWWEFYGFSMDRTAERSTVWAMLKTLFATGVDTQDSVAWVPPGPAVAAALLLALVAIAWLALRSPVRPRLGQLAFLVVLAFLLTTKVWSPQYSLWLVPLLALARPRWRVNIVWQFSEVAVWLLTLTLLLGNLPGQQAHGVGYGWLMLSLLVRDGLLLVLAGLIVRELWRPELDVVRADGTAAGGAGGYVDDPAGGVFDGRPDRARARAVEIA